MEDGKTVPSPGQLGSLRFPTSSSLLVAGRRDATLAAENAQEVPSRLEIAVVELRHESHCSPAAFNPPPGGAGYMPAIPRSAAFPPSPLTSHRPRKTVKQSKGVRFYRLPRDSSRTRTAPYSTTSASITVPGFSS